MWERIGDHEWSVGTVLRSGGLAVRNRKSQILSLVLPIATAYCLLPYKDLCTFMTYYSKTYNHEIIHSVSANGSAHIFLPVEQTER